MLSTRVDLSFSVHKLAKFSSNPGKVHFEGLVNLLKYIWDNKTLGLKHYDDMNDALLYDLFRQARVKTDNQLMDLYYYSWKDCPDTQISTGSYIIFHQGGTIDHGTHVPGPVAQSSTESEYNTTWNTGMDLAHFSMLINE